MSLFSRAGTFCFERRLCRHNPFWGEASEEGGAPLRVHSCRCLRGWWARKGWRGPIASQEHLPEPDGPALEGHGGAGQVQAPRAIDLLAHEGARLVGGGLEPFTQWRQVRA